MKSTEFIRMSLENSKHWAMALINDVQNAPLAQPTSGGNHPLWILGHLVYSEANLIDCFMRAQPNRFHQWDRIFGTGSKPSADAKNYPSMDELLAKFEEVRAAMLAHLDTLGDEDLDRPSHAPKEFGPFFATIGACFAAAVAHVNFHAGQIADVRRALGRSPVMA